MRRLVRLLAAVLLIGLSVSVLFVATANAQRRPGQGPSSQSGGAGGCGACGSCGGCGVVMILLMIVPLVGGGVAIAGVWKTFEKAGEPGWAAIVPVYNMMIMAKISGRDETYGLMCLIPVAGSIFAIIILIDFCKKFDVGGGFVAGLILLPYVFWPIMGFGSTRFLGRRGRRRRVEEDEEEDEPRPRRRRRDEDDEDEDRPRRRRREDD